MNTDRVPIDSLNDISNGCGSDLTARKDKTMNRIFDTQLALDTHVARLKSQVLTPPYAPDKKNTARIQLERVTGFNKVHKRICRSVLNEQNDSARIATVTFRLFNKEKELAFSIPVMAIACDGVLTIEFYYISSPFTRNCASSSYYALCESQFDEFKSDSTDAFFMMQNMMLEEINKQF